MSEIFSELPDDVRRLIEEPLLPLDQVEPYDGEPGVYELGDVQQAGYKKVLLYQAANNLLFIRVVAEHRVFGNSFEVIEASNDMALEGSVHPFPTAPVRDVKKIFRNAA